MPEIKTTIDANVPILMQWIISSPDRLNKEAEPGRHPLPNTETFSHRQRLVNMAEVEPDRLICLYYLGDTLSKEQNKQMEELENLAPNIRVIDFNKLDWSEYDFEFNTNMLSVEDDQGEEMTMTEYLALPNIDNRMGFRLDMMRTLMLLKAEKGVIEAGKVGSWNKPIGEGAIYFDFDFAPNSSMGELRAPYSMITGYNPDPIRGSHFHYANSVMAVTTDKNLILTDAHEAIKDYLNPNKLGPYEEFLHDVKKYYSYDENFYKNERKTAAIIAAIIESKETQHVIRPCINNFFVKNNKNFKQKLNIKTEKYGVNKVSKIPISKDLDLKLAIHNLQVFLAFNYIGDSMAKFILNKAPVETKDEINNAQNMFEKYKLMHEFITEDRISLRKALYSNGVSMNNFVAGNKKCRSWVISENADINKFHGSDTTYTEIFGTMYKDTELEVKKPATSLNDVRLKQQNYGCRIS